MFTEIISSIFSNACVGTINSKRKGNVRLVGARFCDNAYQTIVAHIVIFVTVHNKKKSYLKLLQIL